MLGAVQCWEDPVHSTEDDDGGISARAPRQPSTPPRDAHEHSTADTIHSLLFNVHVDHYVFTRYAVMKNDVATKQPSFTALVQSLEKIIDSLCGAEYDLPNI